MVKAELVPMARVERVIVVLRGHKVILDVDLAALYEVETKTLLRAVHRNIERFPADFMFQLTKDELAILRYQFGTSRSWGGRRYLPYAFSEQGVAMLSTVLRSARAVQVNIEIMRAFVRLRQILDGNAFLAKKLAALEKKYDAQFRIVFDAIRELMEPPTRPTSALDSGRTGLSPGRMPSPGNGRPTPPRSGRPDNRFARSHFSRNSPRGLPERVSHSALPPCAKG